jgi:hypothetical protein
MSFIKNIEVNAALHVSGVENVIGNEANDLYVAFKNIVPKKLRKCLTGDEMATIILRLCYLSDDQVNQLNRVGQNLLRNELSMGGRTALTMVFGAIDAGAEANAA